MNCLGETLTFEIEKKRKFKNLMGTGEKTCKCSSWLKHWENGNGKTANLCMEKTCTKKAEVGAHVKKVDSVDNAHYIIPLCKTCNKLDKEFELYNSPTLVSANVSETCGS